MSLQYGSLYKSLSQNRDLGFTLGLNRISNFIIRIFFELTNKLTNYFLRTLKKKDAQIDKELSTLNVSKKREPIQASIYL